MMSDTGRIADFIIDTMRQPDMANVVVIYKNIDGGIAGQGNIHGVRDMHECLRMLESYAETLRAAIPTLN